MATAMSAAQLAAFHP